MPVYSYKALNEEGAAETGVIDADTPRDARTKLKSRRLHVTAIESLVSAEKASSARVRVPWAGRKARAELPMITRQLGTLLASGIPLMGTLNAIIEQAEERRLRAVLMDVRERVSQGVAFSDALGAHPRLFNELYVNMVRAGEASGALDKILFRLADYLHSARRLHSKIVSALTYPIIMLIVGTVVVVLLMALVVPQITGVLLKQKKVLPLPTEILMTVSAAIRGYWWVGVLGLIAAGIALKRIRATKAGKLWMDTMLLRIPVLGPLLRKSAVSRFALTFATLLESGLPVLECVAVVKRVVNNQLIANVLEDVQRKIAEGADIATPMKQSKVFPPVVGYMIAVGEESGRLEELLKRISQAYDEEIEIAAQRLTSLLEPLMIVTMSLIVGFIVMAILLPILEIGNVV
jgi:general secretion pathway protein F